MDENYLGKIIARTNKRIKNLPQRLLDVKPGEQMPVEEQVTIGSGRQLEVAVLFLDICGYSSWFNDSFDSQKNVLAVMNLFMAEMINIVRDHNGDFEKNTGDGLMSYFGCEEDEPRQAVRQAVEAALTMHFYNDNILTPYFLSQGSKTGINFRIGIDYGKVTIGRVGIPGGMSSFVAIGTTANVACKLLDIAGPGDVVIGYHAKERLPQEWCKYCQLNFQKTGFVYLQNNEPYWAYKYTGRWVNPLPTGALRIGV